MISTPYFVKLQKIAISTSKKRCRNTYVAEILRREGFSPSEINNITETECFLKPRESKKKKCVKCGVNKTISLFKRKGLRCNVCKRAHEREIYSKSFKLKIAKSETNKFYRERTIR